jgi:uncharacterized protein (DUF58 family)
MLLFLAILIVLAAVIEKVTLKDPFKHIGYEIYPSKNTVDPDEEFDVVSLVENSSRRPVLFIEIQENLPCPINVAPRFHKSRVLKPIPGNKEAVLRLTRTTYLMSRQRLERRMPAVIPLRGLYYFPGAVMRSGDFFGLFDKRREFRCSSEIVVKPAPAVGAPELSAMGGFLGSVSVRRFIMEDPVLTMGFREYTGREPQKAIAWKQSARFGSLMVKNYDHTLEPSVTVLLNVDCQGQDRDEQRIERCFSLTRTVCETLEKRGIQYGFITNAATAGPLSRWKYIAEGLGSSHLAVILEGLGRSTYDFRESYEETLERAVRLAESGRSHIIITPYETPSLKAGASRLRSIIGGDTLIVAAESQVL